MMFFEIKGDWYYSAKKPVLEVYETARNDAGGLVTYSAYWKQVEQAPSCFPKEVRQNSKCTFWEIETKSSDKAYDGPVPVTICDCESPLVYCF